MTTVNELIESLQQCNPNAAVFMRDTDPAVQERRWVDIDDGKVVYLEGK